MVFLDMLDRFKERGILEKSPVLNRLAHTGIVLEDAFTRTDILMAYLRITHLALGQADRQAGRFDRCMRPGLCQLVDIWRARQGDGIALFPRIDAPTIHNDQDEGPGPLGRYCTHTYIYSV